MAHILILGGGFGGLAAAHELRDRLGDEHEITLIDRQERFYMGFAKLWDLGGTRSLEDGSRPLGNLERHGIHFVRADVTHIDPEQRTVHTEQGVFAGDALLVAAGAADDGNQAGQLQGAAHNLYDAGALPAMRDALTGLEGGRVVVLLMGMLFKCPPAPYEAALVVDEYLRGRGVRGDVEVVVATPQPRTLPAAGPDASKYLADVLRERGVEVLTEHRFAQIDGERNRVHFGDGSDLDYGLLLGVPESVPPEVVAQSPIAGSLGWIEPDRYTFRTAFERVYGVGDCTLVPVGRRALPKAGVFAEAEGRVAARNIVADLVGGERASFDGHGYCFLELPDRKVAYVEGNFYAEPDPDVQLSPAEEARFEAKQAFERVRLDAWLG